MAPQHYRYDDHSSYDDRPDLSVFRKDRRRERHSSDDRYRPSRREDDRYRPRRHDYEDDNGSLLFEERALDELCENVEAKIPCSPKRNDNNKDDYDASILANTRKNSLSLAKEGQDDRSRRNRKYGDYQDYQDHFDPERGQSSMKGFYLATGNAREMQSVDNRDGQNTAMVGSNSPSNVLAYILGGFGLCPPDEKGMRADGQVQNVSWCAPDKKGLAADGEVEQFQHSNNEWQHEEKKEEAGARNTSFRRKLHQVSTPSSPTNLMRRFDEEQQQDEEDGKESSLVIVKEEDADAPFCSPPCSPRSIPDGDKDDEPFCSPPCSGGGVLTSSMFIPTLDSKSDAETQKAGPENSLLDDVTTESRMDEIRKKKRGIEHQVHRSSHVDTDYHLQNKTRTKTAHQQRTSSDGPSNMLNRAIILFLILLFAGASVLVGIGFFWPKLMS